MVKIIDFTLASKNLGGEHVPSQFLYYSRPCSANNNENYINVCGDHKQREAPRQNTNCDLDKYFIF